MNRTRPTPLIALGLIGGILGFALETVLVMTGRPRFDPPLTLPFALVLISVLVVLLALPVWRSTRRPSGAASARSSSSSSSGGGGGGGTPTMRPSVDPFYATRVVVLAKASAMGGALLAGAGLGILGWLLSRPVVAAGGSTTTAVVATAGAVILLVAGLVAEHLCTVPTDDDRDRGDGRAEPSRS